MKRKILQLILAVARALGCFHVARALTRKELRILCYHGAQIADESAFRPGLFMSAEKFANRMQMLAEGKYPVLPLEEAVERLEQGTLPPNATAITIDDGWYGTYCHQAPALKRHGFPATLYIASYYLEKQTSIFGVAVGYVLWRKNLSSVTLSELGLEEFADFPAGKVYEGGAIVDALEGVAEAMDGADKRQAFFRRFCDGLGFDWAEMEQARQISYMTVEEAAELESYGVDIQLHTHRHRFPEAPPTAVKTEIDDNRAVLEPIAGKPCEHFCYPSGEYTPVTLERLSKLGIKSATTTTPGFNPAGTSPLELNRFLDSEIFSDLEFQAEMSGFFELIRKTGYNI